jgi:hypothetical protein
VHARTHAIYIYWHAYCEWLSISTHLCGHQYSCTIINECNGIIHLAAMMCHTDCTRERKRERHPPNLPSRPEAEPKGRSDRPVRYDPPSSRHAAPHLDNQRISAHARLGAHAAPIPPVLLVSGCGEPARGARDRKTSHHCTASCDMCFNWHTVVLRPIYYKDAPISPLNQDHAFTLSRLSSSQLVPTSTQSGKAR